MSLPTFWSKPPEDARADQVYFYRPDMYQDQDGIERRITLWFNPNARTSLSEALNESQSTGKPFALKPSAPALPAVPATPADSDTEAAPGSNPFGGALDQPFHQGKINNAATNDANSPATNAPAKGPAPSGLKGG
jgi:hypothetical protein